MIRQRGKMALQATAATGAILICWGTHAWADGMPGGSQAPLPAEDASSQATPPDDDYTRAMLAGYAAAEQKNYQTALLNFNQALAERPNDRYALDAIRNMEAYLAQEQAEAVKRQEIARLRGRLQIAVEARDWACAAATVDRMVLLVPPESTDRARLIAYRGEVSGFISERIDVDQWATVCPGAVDAF